METLGRMGASPMGVADGLDRSGDRALGGCVGNDPGRLVAPAREAFKAAGSDLDAAMDKRDNARMAARKAEKEYKAALSAYGEAKRQFVKECTDGSQ